MASIKVTTEDETDAIIVTRLPAVKRFIIFKVSIWKFIKTSFAIQVKE